MCYRQIMLVNVCVTVKLWNIFTNQTNNTIYKKLKGRHDRMVVELTSLLKLRVRTRSCEMYSIQHYVIMFVIDMRQVGGFLRVLRFLPPIILWLNDLLFTNLLWIHIAWYCSLQSINQSINQSFEISIWWKLYRVSLQLQIPLIWFMVLNEFPLKTRRHR
jgi:hypothetical protein